jgi:hypothetical protein
MRTWAPGDWRRTLRRCGEIVKAEDLDLLGRRQPDPATEIAGPHRATLGPGEAEAVVVRLREACEVDLDRAGDKGRDANVRRPAADLGATRSAGLAEHDQNQVHRQIGHEGLSL